MKPLHLFSNAVRAKEIVTALVRYGFVDLIEQLDLPSAWLEKLVSPKGEAKNTWERIRVACEDLGPTFVKIGQLLSTRPDVLPRPLIEELKKLRSQVRAENFARMESLLREELKGEIDDAFSRFDTEPVAAGSIAQVHYAVLKEKNCPVAVKVQRPGIKKSVAADLEILAWFARELNARFEELQPLDLPAVVEEVKRGLWRELDFSNEARNAALFNYQNPYPEIVFSPLVHEEFTTRRLLVFDWVDGETPDRVKLTPEEGRRLAVKGGNSVFNQIVISGFFHSDPHGGNILVTEDHRLCLLDWGLAGHLTREMRYFLADLVAAITTGEADRVVQVASGMARSNRRIDEQKLEKEVTYVLRKYQRFDTAAIAFGPLMLELLYVFGSNGIHLARDYALLAKTVVEIEETGREFDPAFDIREIAKPFFEKLKLERWNLAALFRQTWSSLFSVLSKLHGLPGDLQRLLRRFEEEDVSINLHHKGLEGLEDWVGAAINRLVLAVIIAALIIGSSIVITTGIQPHLWGFPALGIIGYLISALLGFWIVLDILRHGRHR